MDYVYYWETDAPLTQEQEASHQTALTMVEKALIALEVQHSVKVRRLEIWVEGIAYSYEKTRVR